MKAFQIVFAVFYVVYLSADHICENTNTEHLLKFHPTRHCQRSNKSIVALGNFRTVKECEDFARESHALAFNYAPADRGTVNKYEKGNETSKGYVQNKLPSGKDIIEQSEEYYNCQVLQCPEIRNFSSMVNDTRFEYYSLFANPPPPDNATCVPGLGMFIYFDKPENFSRAFNICREVNGSLAHILTEVRTNSLSKLIRSKFNSTHREMAFIDLKEKEQNGTAPKFIFETSENFTLDCFPYRAWSPGFPRKFKHTACATITLDNSWKVVPCSKKQPFICEIFPTGPDKRIRPLRKCSIRKSNNP